MGVFSTVCCMSKLPIYGVDIVNFLLIKNDCGHNCHSNSHWNISSLPMYGTNDNYGRNDINETHKYTIINDRFLKSKNIKLDEIQRPFEPCDYGIMTIHKEVYDYVIKTKLKTAKKCFEMCKENTGHKNKIATYNLLKAELEKIKDTKQINELTKHLKFLNPELIPNIMSDHYQCDYDFIKWLNEFVGQNKEAESDIVSGIIEMIAVNLFAYDTHTVYEHQWTVGSQLPEWDKEVEIHKAILKIAEKNLKRHPQC